MVRDFIVCSLVGDDSEEAMAADRRSRPFGARLSETTEAVDEVERELADPLVRTDDVKRFFGKTMVACFLLCKV